MFEFSSLPSASSASSLLQQILEPSSMPQSQLSVSLNVIPDEDPQRAVETADQPEDDYAGLMEDGLGNEGCDGDDFIDDEADDTFVTGADIQDRFALPHWLSVTFKVKLEEASNRGGDGLPKLYSVHMTFWFPQ